MQYNVGGKKPVEGAAGSIPPEYAQKRLINASDVEGIMWHGIQSAPDGRTKNGVLRN